MGASRLGGVRVWLSLDSRVGGNDIGEGGVLEEWITGHKLPLGWAVKQFISWLQAHASWFFDLITDGISFLVDGLTAILLHIPAGIIILAVAALAYWLQKSWKLALFVIVAFLLIANLGYWTATVQTVSLVGFSTIVSVLIGVPLGIAAAHRPWLYTALRPVLDLMQTLPTFVYLIPTLVLFGLGAAPGLISTVIFAIAAPIRLTHLGITSVPLPLKEAGEAFGATKSQLLWKVEIPYALPTIMAGVTQCIMLSLSMVVIAALVGAEGLGTPVVRALGQVNIPMGFEAGMSIVLLAIVLDRVCRRPERKASA
jgi:glycine betaine/proline transport system permease protein